jgi:site-specific DNA-cytosine methylase
VELDQRFNPSLCINIMDLTPEMILEKFGHPDIIWASPPCTTFSVAALYRYWEDGEPKNDKSIEGMMFVFKTLQLIRVLKPKFFIIENPRGMLRKQSLMRSYPRATVSYCQYGDKIMKPTDLWHNLGLLWIPRKMCHPGDSCHEKASRGAKKGVQGINNKVYNQEFERSAINRGIIPRQLCIEIVEACERGM